MDDATLVVALATERPCWCCGARVTPWRCAECILSDTSWRPEDGPGPHIAQVCERCHRHGWPSILAPQGVSFDGGGSPRYIPDPDADGEWANIAEAHEGVVRDA